jgi:hypothetical protein
MKLQASKLARMNSKRDRRQDRIKQLKRQKRRHNWKRMLKSLLKQLKPQHKLKRSLIRLSTLKIERIGFRVKEIRRSTHTLTSFRAHIALMNSVLLMIPKSLKMAFFLKKL